MTLSNATERVLFCLIFGFTVLMTGCQSGTADDVGEAPVNQPDESVVATATADGSAAMQGRQDRLKTILAKAAAQASAGQHDSARKLYEEALRHAPNNTEALEGKALMLKLLRGDRGVGDQDAVNRAIALEERRRQQAAVHWQEGLEALAEGRLDDAVVALDKCRLLVKHARVATDPSREKAEALYQEAVARRDQADREREQRQQSEIARMQSQEEERERLRLQRRLAALWDNALARFEAEDFERAEWILDEIIRIDFTDSNAGKLKEAARRARHQIARDQNISNYREMWQRVLEEVKESAVLMTEDVTFPDRDKWAAISARGPIRLSPKSDEEADEDRVVRQRLASTALPRVDWNGKTLDDVVMELRPQLGVNIIVTPLAREAAGDVGELSIDFTNVAADHALSAVCAEFQITYSVTAGLVKIQTLKESRKNKVVEMYDVRDLVSPISSFPGVALNLNASGVGLKEDFGDDDKGEPNQAIEVDRLVELIKSAVDPAWDEDDGNRLNPKNGTIVVRQTAEKHRLVRKLLADLRKNTGIQVSIESRFITVENNFLQEVGVDLRGLGDDSGGVGLAGPGNSKPFDDFGITGTGVGTPTQPTGIGSGGDSGFTFNDYSNIDIRSRSENLFDERLGNPNILDGSGGVAFQFAFLDDVQLEAILRAVQKYERINQVTAPSLMVYNTQRANLTVLNEIAYVKDYDVEIAQASVVADPVIDKIREGVVLDVRPIVSHDRRFVTLELRPTVATLVRPIRNFQTQLGVGAAVTLQLPELHKESVNTTVVVPDGGTLLLGGLKFAEEKLMDSGIPILKDIPILSFFFSRRGKYTNLKDLIILLKVEIVIMEEREPQESDNDFLN